MKYLFILNPVSGIKKNPHKIIEVVHEIFRNSEHEYEFAFTTHAGDGLNITKQSVNEKFDIIVAAGGDGTINEVASGMIGSEPVLGIIPLGSGNGIARSYNIPLNMKQSIEFLVNPKITKVDVGQINENYFLGVCGMGYDALIGKKFQEFGVRGPLPYFLIGLREYIRYKPEKLCLEFNNKRVEVSPLLMTVSNTEQYGNGAIISPNANPQDGVLEICIINPMNIFSALKASFKLFNKRINEISQYSMYKTDQINIITDKEGAFHTDGEPHDREQVSEIRLLKNALNVCANLN